MEVMLRVLATNQDCQDCAIVEVMLKVLGSGDVISSAVASRSRILPSEGLLRTKTSINLGLSPNCNHKGC